MNKIYLLLLLAVICGCTDSVKHELNTAKSADKTNIAIMTPHIVMTATIPVVLYCSSITGKGDIKDINRCTNSYYFVCGKDTASFSVHDNTENNVTNTDSLMLQTNAGLERLLEQVNKCAAPVRHRTCKISSQLFYEVYCDKGSSLVCYFQSGFVQIDLWNVPDTNQRKEIIRSIRFQAQ
jgi:hypothetical protein